MTIARPHNLVLLLAMAASAVACAPPDDFDENGDDTATGDDAIQDTLRFDVITHNIAGGALNSGNPNALDNVESEIAASKPDVVMLQEVCQTQYTAFAAMHPGWSVEFRVTRPNHPNCGPLGHLVASPHGLANVVETDLGDADPGKSVTLLCGDISFEKRKGFVHACSTHLRTKGDDAEVSDEARAREVGRMIDALHPYIAAGAAVVVAGDMNSGPQKPLMDPIFRLQRNGNWGGGPFDEADQTDPNREQYKEGGVSCAPGACRSGEPTHDNSKLDHIFFSSDKIAGDIGAHVGNAGKSDHHLYRGFADLDLPPKKKK